MPGSGLSTAAAARATFCVGCSLACRDRLLVPATVYESSGCAFRDSRVAARVLVHDDAVAVSEFQEFAIDTGIQTISIFARSALTPRVYDVFVLFVWDVAKFATHDRCRKYVSSFDKVKIEGDKFKETKATAARPLAQTCSLLANRNSVVHFGGFRGQSRLDGSAHHAQTRNLESPGRQERDPVESATSFPLEASPWSWDRPCTSPP